jgi:hypothetical protein
MTTRIKKSHTLAFAKNDPHKVLVAAFFVGSSFLDEGYYIFKQL